MSDTTKILGILVMIIGIIGILGFSYMYFQVQSQLTLMTQIEQTADAASAIATMFSFVPGVGVAATGANTIASTVANIRNAINLFFLYNFMLNLALVFTGIALVSIGQSAAYHEHKIHKIRKYLKKEKDKS